MLEEKIIAKKTQKTNYKLFSQIEFFFSKKKNKNNLAISLIITLIYKQQVLKKTRNLSI